MNYSTLLHELAREVERCRRGDSELACCFCDLDGYKHVNDRYGHERGNDVLRAVGQALRSATRAPDTVGRYGGDEFVMVLPGTLAQQAVLLAYRARRVIRELPAGSVVGGLDVSIGVAQWHAGQGADALLGDADQALRAAKAAGGGRIVTSAELAREVQP